MNATGKSSRSFINKDEDTNKDEDINHGHAREYLGLIMILVFGAALRFLRLDYQSMWFDELYNVRARKLPLVEIVPEVIAAGHPPAFIFIAHFWNWAGSSETAVRSLSALIGVATIAVAYLAGRELFSRNAGLWAAALMACSPFLIWYSRDATSYSWVIFISLLSFYFLARSSRRGGWRNWTGYVLITGVAAFSHFYMIAFIFACLPVYWILRRARSDRWAWVVSQSAVFAIVVASMGIGRAIAGDRTDLSMPVFSRIMDGVFAAPIVYLQGYVKLFGKPHGGTQLSNKYWLLALAMVMIAAAAMLIAQKKKWRFPDRGVAAVATTLVLYISTTALLHSMLGGFNSGRYYAMGAPLLLLVLAAFVNSIPKKTGILTGVVILAASLFMTTLELKEYRNDDWRGVMSVISKEARPGDRILCYPVHHCVAAADFYLGQQLLIRGGHVIEAESSVIMKVPESGWVSYRADQEPGSYEEFSGIEIEKKLDADLAGGDRVWLIAGDGRYGFYPRADCVFQALASDWDLRDSWNYSPLVLSLYQRIPGNRDSQ